MAPDVPGRRTVRARARPTWSCSAGSGSPRCVDLRSTAEWESGRFPIEAIQVDLHHLPIVEEVLDPTRYELPEGMLAARYQDYTRLGPDHIAKAISFVADPANHPIVVHCLAGKDRTGVVVALILSLLGVDDDTVAEDYALSNLSMARLRQRAIDARGERPFHHRRARQRGLLGPAVQHHLALRVRCDSRTARSRTTSSRSGSRPAEVHSLREGLLE